jgi:hypothetical protein
MNKKTLLFLILLGVLILPVFVSAAEDATTMIGRIQTATITIGGSIVVIGFVIAGILFLTSGGSPEKFKNAKTAAFAAVIGTVLIVMATFAYGVINSLLGQGK